MSILNKLADIKREEKHLNDKLNDIIIKRLIDLGAVGAIEGSATLIKVVRTPSDRDLPVAVWVERGSILKANYTRIAEGSERTITVTRIMDVYNFKQNKKICERLAGSKQKLISLRVLNGNPV